MILLAVWVTYQSQRIHLRVSHGFKQSFWGHLREQWQRDSKYLSDRQETKSFFLCFPSQILFFSILDIPQLWLALSHTSGKYLQIDVWAASPPVCYLSRSSVQRREACRWGLTSSWFYKNRNWSLSSETDFRGQREWPSDAGTDFSLLVPALCSPFQP